MSATLFVTACSLTKETAGTSTYDAGAAITAAVEKDRADRLLVRRKEVRALVNSGDTEWQGIRLADLPYNQHLAGGRDFGGTRQVAYLSAMDRYNGRFFLALGAAGRQRCKAEGRTVIVVRPVRPSARW